jgi:acyl carrier protein
MPCRPALLTGAWPLASFRLGGEREGSRVANQIAGGGRVTTGQADPERIHRWIVVYLAVLVGRSSDTIDSDSPLSDFDLDSVDAVEMAAEFEKAFGLGIGPEFFLRGEPTVRDMVEALVEGRAA